MFHSPCMHLLFTAKYKTRHTPTKEFPMLEAPAPALSRCLEGRQPVLAARAQGCVCSYWPGLQGVLDMADVLLRAQSNYFAFSKATDFRDAVLICF